MFLARKVDSYIRNFCMSGTEVQCFICAPRPFYMSFNATAAVSLKERKRIQKIRLAGPVRPYQYIERAERDFDFCAEALEPCNGNAL